MILENRCRNDVVLDTNVMAHADHGAAPYHESALALLTAMSRTKNVKLVLDDQGKVAPDLSTSVLASEYRATLSPQGLGLTLFATLLASGRVGFAPRPDAGARRNIARLVPKNTCDRAVLGAAVGCVDKVLVSNDYSDFSDEVRSASAVQIGVQIIDSMQAVA